MPFILLRVFIRSNIDESSPIYINTSVENHLTGLQLLLAPQNSNSKQISNLTYDKIQDVKSQKSNDKLISDSDRIIVYTDGSCFNNGRKGALAGIGAYFPSNIKYNISEPLSGKQTNQCAELTAILTTLKKIASTPELSTKKVLIKTDSEYSINVITKWIPSWRAKNWSKKNGNQISNLNLIVKLDQEIQNMRKRVGNGSLKLEHVYGHSNDFGNDMADKLAKNGASILVRY